jgi:hypothetical protein
MNTSPTLTAKEFKDIHNAKCELHGILQSLEGVVHPKMQERFEKALKQINAALKNAYAQDDAAAKKKSAHYEAIAVANDFTSVWSVYEVDDLNAPFTGGGTHLAYEAHWGKKDIGLIPIDGNTWVDLWRAAEAAIEQSGDNHHIFIEGFTPSVTWPGVLVLSTGS